MLDDLAQSPPSSEHTTPGSVITVYEDGPYLVRGDYVVRAQDGEELELTRRTIALCRCGKSRIRPLCDGTHRLIKFHAPGARELDLGSEPSRPSVAPGATRSAAPTNAGSVLRSAERAHGCLLESLLASCPARDYVAMRLAEPLVGAACSLLRWSMTGTDDVVPSQPSAGETGVAECRALVSDALSQAMRLPKSAPSARAEQTRSLLSDAALALRADARTRPGQA